jgi:Protein of unknown function (DUF2000)
MTTSEPTTHKFIAVLNKKIEPGSLMNALGHMAVGFGASYPDKESMRFDSYVDKNGGEHPNISDNPFIVLRADNSNKIRTLRNELIANNIPFTDFTNTMTAGAFAEQKKRTSETSEEDLEYYGICFFGEQNKLSELTRKFSLWR